MDRDYIKAETRRAIADEYPDDQRGDAWEGPTPSVNGQAAYAAPEEPPPAAEPSPQQPAFPAPIPASQLQVGEGNQWLWRGYIADKSITLFSALWKAGKTTLLAHLVKAMERGNAFAGQEVLPSQVLYVTEEHETRWARRRDEMGLADHVHFLPRSFKAKPNHAQWKHFLAHVAELVKARGYHLVIFDTLANLWPVRDENDASEVQGALMPLHGISESASLLLAHHIRKSDGNEATASRGSGALPAFVDTIIELRRHTAGDRHDRRRVLTAYGRWDETPGEMVIELEADGSTFRTHGDRQEVSAKTIRQVVVGLLPNEGPGIDLESIQQQWPDPPPPGRSKLLEALRMGKDNCDWEREGTGKKGSPYTYWTRPPG